MRYVKIAALVLAALLALAAKRVYDQSKTAEAALAETKRRGEEIQRDLKRNQDAARLMQADLEDAERRARSRTQ